jgi:hypothetical protein
VQLQKQLTEPARTHHTVGHGVLLHLSTQLGDNILALRGPRDDVLAQKHCIAQSGLASVGTTSPVRVSVDDELRRRGTVKKQTMVKGALEVAEDALHNREMRLRMVGHVEAHLLDREGDVRPGEGEVLESPNQVAISSRVVDRGAQVK